MNETKIAFDFNPVHFSPKKVTFGREFKNRIIQPPMPDEIPEEMVKYKFAKDFADKIQIQKGSRYCAVINGSFIFGDFIEALVVKQNYHVKKMTIGTLSMSENNIDSLRNLLKGGYVDELDLIVSHHFFSHERNNLIQYAYEQLDFEDKFQLAVAGTHQKTCIIETHCGLFIVMDGSANLRSSGNIEHFRIEESKFLYDWMYEWNQEIVIVYKTIKKGVRYEQLWKAITK